MFSTIQVPRSAVRMRHLQQEARIAMRITAAMILATLAINWPATAQEKMETTVYKVEFNIHDGSDATAKAAGATPCLC